MNIKFKKVISIFISMLMLFMASASISAQNIDNHYDAIIDSELLSRGYPQIIIDSMSLVAKESIYNDNELTYVSGTVTTYDDSTGESYNYTISEDNILPIGQISRSDLSLTWVVSRKASMPDVLLVTYSYDWKDLPLNRWQDAMAVSWDPNLFEMKTDSFHKIDLYDGYYKLDNFGLIKIEEFTRRIQSEEYGYAKANAEGVTWYADLRGYLGEVIQEKITRLYGYGDFYLTKKVDTGTATIYGYYVHEQLGSSLSIDIVDVGSFNIEGGGSTSEMGNQYTFDF